MKEIKMGKVYCLMGKSASGKDTVYRALLAETGLSLKEVILYTTRPIRSGETDGVTYHFCTQEDAKALCDAGKVIEMRTYQTVHGPWSYFTVDDGQIDLETSDYLLIGTLESFAKIRAYFGADHVAGIYIYTDDGLRLSRALERERKQAEPKYAELCRRFLADEQDFSEENLCAAGIDIRIENLDLADTVSKAAFFIQNGKDRG